MRYSLFVPLLVALVPAVHVSAQTGRTMSFQTPAAIGADFVFSATYPPAAIGNPYALLWSVPYAGAVPLLVPGFVTNGLLRLDPAQLTVWFLGAFDASGTATHTVSIPDDVNLLGFGLDFQVVDIDLAVPSLNFTDNDLAMVVGGLRQDWAVVYDGPVSGHDSLRAVAADANVVVVTGSSLGFRPWSPFNPYTYEVVTQSYTTNGALLWERRYDSPGSGFDDTGVDVVLAANGDVTVLGQGPGASGDQDVVLLRYDAQGTQQWVTTWNHTWSDSAIDLVVAGDGSLYVLASAYNPASVTDITLLKFSAAGTLQWERYFHGGYGGDIGVGLALDSHGNIDIGGRSIGPGVSTNFDWVALEYDPAGNLLWSQRLVGSPTLPDYCWAMTVDGLDRVVLTGSLNGVPGGYALAAFDDVGIPLWTTPVAGGSPYSTLCGDALGNVYCASGSTVLAVGATGTVLWQSTITGTARAIALGAAGHVLVTSDSMVLGSMDQFAVSAFTATGSSLGQRIFGGAREDLFAPRGLATFGGNLYAVGSARNAANNNDGYLTGLTLFP